MVKRSEEPRITLTEGSIRVHWGARILTILPASSPPKAEDPADFTVDLDSILTWDGPHGDIEIEVAELQKFLVFSVRTYSYFLNLRAAPAGPTALPRTRFSERQSWPLTLRRPSFAIA